MMITVSLASSISFSHPLPTASSIPSKFRSEMYEQALRTTSRKPVGVWKITKYSSILGPTVAIYLYKQVREIVERHEPFITAKIQDFVQRVAVGPETTAGASFNRPMPNGNFRNPYVMKIANEIVRIANRRLRERAVLSRIQMDDDQYEFSRHVSASDVKELIQRVTVEVLTCGAGQFLKPDEKKAVQILLSNSAY